MEFFELEAELLANGNIPVHKYKSKREDGGLNVYFIDIESQVINGYFCFGIDQPEATRIETMLWHLDSSGGLLPKSMRSDIVKPAWQFHGAENPLSDRDQSCYICTALGEKVFVGSFTCALYLIQNIEAVFDAHGFGPKDDEENGARPPPDAGDADTDLEPRIQETETYYLSETGEGAMAWEGTLQLLFPGTKTFHNRLLDTDEKPNLLLKMWKCYQTFYRPENLSVIIAGKLMNREAIFSVLGNYEANYFLRANAENPYMRPWNKEIPKPLKTNETSVSVARYVPRNPNRDPAATVCLGWRGCCSKDIENVSGLKALTAYLAVGPLWNTFVATGLVQRISWCQLEYQDSCSLITFHGVKNDEVCENIIIETDRIIAEMADDGNDFMKIEELQAMSERVGWHYVREIESDPFLIIASCISKGERYAKEKELMEKRLNPQQCYSELVKKPLDYWKSLLKLYFVNGGTFVTKVLPKSYEKQVAPVPPEASSIQQEVEAAEVQQFTSSSRRASSRPRRRSSSVAVEIASTNENLANAAGDKAPPLKEIPKGHIEEILKSDPYPFGDRKQEVEGFKKNLESIATYLEDFIGSQQQSFHKIETYKSDGNKQHPLFPVNDMPFYTILEDTNTSFVYATMVFDTTDLDSEMRKVIAPITAAIGAAFCPRPPSLDTDNEIVSPNEFNPPQHIADSQVSLGLNGELMQSIFVTVLVLPEKYDWLVGLFHNFMYKFEYTVNFLKFVCEEAVKGLAANYRMQTAEVPNYDCFDGTEINLHALINMIYKPESNARLFVGRRRLDGMNEFVRDLGKNPDAAVKLVNDAWKKLVTDGRILVQIAGNVSNLAEGGKNLVEPWKKYFNGIQRSLKFEEARPKLESELMQKASEHGIAVNCNNPRPSCLTTAIHINPNDDNFSKLCIAAQLFSMAQKWVWSCLDEEDAVMPVLRMPCSYSNILTMNLESHDIIGALEVMKKILNDDWEWLEPILIATKYMVVNDPAAVDQGPQGTITLSLLAQLCGISLDTRRNLVLQSLSVTLEDVKDVIRTHLRKLFDPKQCWYSLMSFPSEQDNLIQRLEEFGFKFVKKNLNDICTQV